MQVTQLNLYPIKSTQAYRVEQAFVQPQGLNFDREFMITEPDGTFITARKDKVLYQLSAFPISSYNIMTKSRSLHHFCPSVCSSPSYQISNGRIDHFIHSM